MKTGRAKKLLAFSLGALMLIGSVTPVFAANTDDTEDGGKNASTGVTLQEYQDDLKLLTYEEYKTRYGYEDAERSGEEFTVDARDYFEASESAEVEKTTWEGRDCLKISENGSVSWKFDVPESGFYSIRLTYSATGDSTNDIERLFALNGRSPFEEARFIRLNKNWKFQFAGDTRDDAFVKDSAGNELNPDPYIDYVWDEYDVVDPNGYYLIPLEFYLEAGENVLTLEAIREPMAIEKITFYTYEEPASYEEVKKEYEDKGYKAADTEPIKLEAEMPDSVSAYTIYPIYDRTSAGTSPQDHAVIRRNTMGGDKWLSSGQWVKYKFECPASGLYDIVLRYEQATVKGMYTSRSLKINGEYPFLEAKYCQFPYDSKWQSAALNDGETTFQFYFEEGETYELEFEATKGTFTDILRQTAAAINSLNEDYMDLIKLTGTDPDVNRDYGFSRIMPDTIKDLGRQYTVLLQLVDYISEINGTRSENVSTLEQAALVIEKMVTDEKEIAANLQNLKSWISSLGTWLDEASKQYLQVDFLMIQPSGSELPRGDDSVWSSLAFEFKKFLSSFFTDYNSIGVESDEVVETTTNLEVWTSKGRDTAQLMKNLINTGFSQDTGIGANIKLTGQNVVLPSILAGVGPDISLDAGDMIEMALRGAILPLNDFDTFEEVTKRFSDTAMNNMTLYGKAYGIPFLQGFAVMFVRDDVMQSMGLEVPKTWDELIALIPTFQFNNMDIGFQADYRNFIYQRGGSLWEDEGLRTAFDSDEAIEAFSWLVNLYSQYDLNKEFEAANRFKSGEMPIILSDYQLYNTLQIFAPEIANLWSFYQLPGIQDPETGEINRTIATEPDGVYMTRDCRNPEAAWDLLDYIGSKEYQVNYSEEMVALLGPSAKQQLANIEALSEQPWTEKEYKTLEQCLRDSFNVPAYPGNYFVARYANFVINRGYTEGADPGEMLFEYASAMNKEITRKRREFKLMVDDEWQAIRAYMDFEDFSEWREYWNETYDITDVADNSCMDYSDEYEYSFRDWMDEHNVSVRSHESWEADVKADKTDLSYKEWLEK